MNKHILNLTTVCTCSTGSSDTSFNMMAKVEFSVPLSTEDDVVPCNTKTDTVYLPNK